MSKLDEVGSELDEMGSKMDDGYQSWMNLGSALDEDGHQNWMKWDKTWMKMGMEIG